MAKIILEKDRIVSGGGVSLSDYLGQTIQNSESDLLVIDGKLYKILDGTLARKRKRIMEFFHERKTEFPITLEDLYYEDCHFYAYSMELLEQYQTLYVFLKSDISLALRKEVCLLMIKVIQKLESYGLLYYDLHFKNFMFGQDLKILDIDSTIETKNVQYVAKARKNLLQLCISVLSGTDFDFDSIDFSELKKDSLLNALVLGDDMFFSDIIPLSYDFITHYVEDYSFGLQEEQSGMILKIAR